jgi:hypothetical protein
VTYRILLIAAALNGAVFGLLFVLVPDFTISLFGGRLDSLASILVRQFGGVILGIAILDWLLRMHDERSVRRAVVAANVTAFVVIAAAAAYAALTGVTNGLAWVVAVFHAGVALGLAVTYVSSNAPGSAERAPI